MGDVVRAGALAGAAMYVWMAALPTPAIADSPGAAAAGDAAADLSRIRITAHSGRVAWGDVLKGIARAKGFDDSALDGLLPAGDFPIDSTRARLVLVALTAALQPAVRFSVERSGQDDVLVVELSRSALLASERRMKQLMRDALVDAMYEDPRQFGLELDDGWQEGKQSKKNLVVFVHGLDSAPEQTCVTAIRPLAKKRGFPTGSFRYPNDQGIAASAQLLSRELRELARVHPKRRVTLVAKSMGGLVARAAVEDPALDPRNVDRLILVGTPNHGSMLAHFAFGLELWEHLAESRAAPARSFYESIEDGMGEAADDLVPDSPFLIELNARPRNPRVKYSLFLGTAGPLTRVELEALRLALRSQRSKSRFLRFFGPKLDQYLGSLDEVIEGVGDGAVSLERGKLEGVDDVTILPFDHVSGARDNADLRRGVLKRL